MNHTQGAWRTGDAGKTIFGPKTDSPSPVTIAEIAESTRVTTEEKQANARLIAAAPELLDALTKLQNELRQHIKFDVKKHYSLMVIDADATRIIRKINGDE